MPTAELTQLKRRIGAIEWRLCEAGHPRSHAEWVKYYRRLNRIKALRAELERAAHQPRLW